MMRSLLALHKSVLFLRYDAERGFGQRRTINVWWRGQSSNADLMLLLAHLIQQHRTWKEARIRLLLVIDSEEGAKPYREHMRRLLQDIRVEAEPIIIVRTDAGKALTEIIAEWSRDADLTLLGIHLPGPTEVKRYSQGLHELIQAVGTVLLVRNAEVEEDLLSTG